MIDRAARDRAARAPRRARLGARAGPALPLRRRARGGRARAAPTGSRTPSTTATSSPACARSRTARAYHLLEALAAALADELLARFPVERVSVRVRKPEVVLDPPVEYAAVARDATVTLAYVGLGANLGDREATIRRARSRCCRASIARLGAPRDGSGRRHRPAALPERRRRARDRALAARAARRAARGRARARPRARASAGGRARSTSTCSSTATRRSTSRG